MDSWSGDEAQASTRRSGPGWEGASMLQETLTEPPEILVPHL